MIDGSAGCFDYGISTTPPGFVVEYVPFAEGFGGPGLGGGSCGPDWLGVEGGCGEHVHYVLVERADRGCGAFTLTVTATLPGG